MRDDPRAARRLYAGAALRFLLQVLAMMLVAQLALTLFAWNLSDRFVVPALERKAENAGLAMARNLTRAIAAGVPFDRLEGVPEYFDSVLADNSDLAYVILTDGAGKLLVRAGRGGEVVAPEQYVAATNEVERRFVTYGQVHVGVDRRFITARIRTIRNDTGALFLAGLAVAFELAWFAAAAGFTTPLGHLGELLTRMAAGDYRFRPQNVLPRPLTGALEQLHGRLNQAWDELARAARERHRWAHFQPLLKRLRTLYRFAEGGTARDAPLDRSAAVRALCFGILFADALARPFLPVYAVSLAGMLPAPLRAGLPVAAGLAAFALGLPLARDWVRAAGRRNAFVAGALLASLAAAANGFVADAAVLLVGRALTGVGYAAMVVAALEAGAVAAERRSGHGGPAMLAVAFMMAEISAPVLGGVLADTAGPRAVFLAAAAILVACALLAIGLFSPRRPDPYRPPARVLGGTVDGTDASPRQHPVGHLRALALAGAFFLFGAMVTVGIPGWLDATAHSTASIGRYEMVLAASPLLLLPLHARLAWRSDSCTLLLVLAAALAAGGMLPFLRPAWAALRPAALLVLGSAMVLGCGVQLVLVERAHRARTLRYGAPEPAPWQVLTPRVALGVGPLVAGAALAWGGADAAILGLGAAFLGVLAVFGALLYRAARSAA